MNEAEHERHLAETAEAEIKDDLRRIYETEEGALPDFSSLEAPKRSWRRTGLVLSGVLLLLTAAISAGFFFLGGPRFVESDYLTVEITAEPTSAEEDEGLLAGSPSRVTVRYENVSRVPIASLSLHVNLPDAFVSDRFVPEPTSAGNTWDLGSLGAGSDGQLDLYGTFVGAVPSTAKVQAIASYRPANFSSEFDLITVEDIPLEKSAVGLTLTAPAPATAGEETDIAFELLNPTSSAVKETLVQLIAPTGFSVVTSEPPLEEGRHWRVPRLEAHSKTRLTLSGRWSANTEGLQDVGGEVFFVHEGERFSQVRVTQGVEVTAGALSAELLLNGTGRDQNVEIGSLLRLSIPYKNTSGKMLEDVEVRLTISGAGNSPIHWDGAGSDLGDGTRNGSMIVWERETGEGMVNLTLPLFPDLPQNSATALTFVATVSAKPTTGDRTRIEISTTPVTIQFVAANTEVDSTETEP